MRYGILIRSACWGDRRVLVRQLAHTAQYERLGSISAFLECYLHERFLLGEASSPMEQEAISVVRRIFEPDPSFNTTSTPQHRATAFL
jgi:hypothetical protein